LVAESTEELRAFSDLEGPNLYDFLKIFLYEGTRDPLKILTQLKRDYGSTVRVNVPDFGGEILLLSDPDLMEKVLLRRQKEFEKPDTAVSDDVETIMGEGLLTTDGKKWRRQHRLLIPHFQEPSVAEMVPFAVEETERLLDRWSSDSFNQPFSLFREMKRVGLRFISRALFSYQMSSEQTREIRESIDTLREIYRHRRTSLITLPLWVPTPKNRRVKDARDRLYRFADKLIGDRRSSDAEREDMLGSMVKACYEESEQQLTEDEMRAQIVTFIIAGYTTTAAAMGWMSYELMKQPGLTKKVQEESSEAWAGYSVETVLDSIPLTRAAFDETLRLYPTAPWIARSNKEEITLGDFRLPAGTPIVMTPYLMHHNDDFYDRPDEFRPERFLGEDSPGPLTYIPFSVGAHQCIGREIALMEGPLILSKIFSQGRFERIMATPESASIHTAVNLEPQEPVPVRFQFE
jgi:cytochrome P450